MEISQRSTWPCALFFFVSFCVFCLLQAMFPCASAYLRSKGLCLFSVVVVYNKFN